MFVSRKKYDELARQVKVLENAVIRLADDNGYVLWYYGDKGLEPCLNRPTLHDLVYGALRHFGITPILEQKGTTIKFVKKETPCQQQ